MEAIIARIKGYVLVLYPTILTELSITDAYLDFVIADVVDRALIIMNREQLVAQYELDLVSYPDLTNRFWTGYTLPIPKEVERLLAKTVVETARTMVNNKTAELGAVKSVSDNGQSVTYSDQLTHFFSSSNDAEIFSGSLGILKRYLIATVIKNENTY